MRSIGENIRILRRMRKLTQVELAEKTNLSRSYLADIERGRYNPSIETLNTIAKALNVNVTQLIDTINFELSERLRIILLELSEGSTILNRKFPDRVITMLRDKLKDVELAYGITFMYEPESIRSVCMESNNEALIVDVVKKLEEVKLEIENKNIETIAAHKEGDDDWTEEELETIEKFKQFLRSQRNKDKE